MVPLGLLFCTRCDSVGVDVIPVALVRNGLTLSCFFRSSVGWAIGPAGVFPFTVAIVKILSNPQSSPLVDFLSVMNCSITSRARVN